MRIKCSKNLFALSLLAALSACSDSDNGTTPMRSYEVSIYNITANQPLTPVAVVAHTNGYTPWTLGMAASEGLEMLAESGDTGEFFTASKMNGAVEGTATGAGVIMPGNMETISIQAPDMDGLEISVATMLANTNDAFTGVANWQINDLVVNAIASTMTKVYDAGTESNSEMSGTIPGPADGGTGFSATRDDLNRITIHPGVVTKDDGLASSVLNESHRWLGPAAKVVVRRIK